MIAESVGFCGVTIHVLTYRTYKNWLVVSANALLMVFVPGACTKTKWIMR